MTFPKRHAMVAAALGAGATIFPATDALAIGPVTRDDQAIRPVARMAVQAHSRAVRSNVKLKRTHTRLRGAEPRRERRDVRDWTLAHLREDNRELKRKNRRLRRAVKASGRATPGGATATPGHLQSIAACESGGDPGAVDASGTYRGKYQFDVQTWQSVGGSGDPAAASEAEQDRRAAQLYAQRGSSPWPVCGG